MKIAIFSNLYSPNILGGAEKSTQLLAEGLLKKGLKPIVITTADRSYVDHVNGVKVYYVHYANLYWRYKSREQWLLKKLPWYLIDIFNPFILKEIKKVIQKEKIEIAHTNNICGFSVSIWKLLHDNDIPILHTIRDYYLLCANSAMFKNDKSCGSQCLTCAIFSVAKRYMSNYVSGVAGASGFILKKHEEYGFFRNAIVKETIYNPIFPESAKNLQTLNKTYPNRLNFGYVGLLSPHKGTEFLLRTFNKFKNANLLLYGIGKTKKYEEYLRGTYNSPNIKFMGWVSDIEQIYKNMDVLIIPSLWNEPFCRCALEGYYYGIPVIASCVGGMSELVDEGRTGFTFKPGDENGLLDILKQVIADKMFLERLRQNCFEKSKDFSLESHVDRYLNVYQLLLEKHRMRAF
jgi:glycosyltransferase involved in cell wall biosynthesis